MSVAVEGLVGGLLLGAAFFLGLRWTVERVPGSRRPALLVAVSFAFRLAFLGAGLVVLLRRGGWVAGVAALAGILVGRTLVLRRGRGAADGGTEAAARRVGPATRPVRGGGSEPAGPSMHPGEDGDGPWS